MHISLQKFMQPCTRHRWIPLTLTPATFPVQAACRAQRLQGQVAYRWPTGRLSRWRKNLTVRQSRVSAETGRRPAARRRRSQRWAKTSEHGGLLGRMGVSPGRMQPNSKVEMEEEEHSRQREQLEPSLMKGKMHCPRVWPKQEGSHSVGSQRLGGALGAHDDVLLLGNLETELGPVYPFAQIPCESRREQ